MHQKNSLKVGDTIGLVRMGHKDLYIAKHRPWDEKGNKIMNIEIGNTTQTFELENEVIWHLKEKKTRFEIIRLLFTQIIIRSRTVTSFECSESLVSIKSSKFTPQICHDILWTVL